MKASKPILESLPARVRSDVLARFDLLIDRSGGPDACWPYLKGTQRGYGKIWVPKPDGGRRMVLAHRLAFEVENGHVDETVDHICHDHETCAGGPTCPHRRCCNPAHLVAATNVANARRAQLGRKKNTCLAGHELTDENTYHSPFGGRRCRTCAAAQMRSRRAEAAAQRKARPKKRRYRPRGMTREQLVRWLLEGAETVRGGCMIPDTPANGSGYRTVGVDGRATSVHRLVFEVKHGPIPDGMVVDHTCHDPRTCPGGLTCPHRACCNPAHLALATYGENVAEARASRLKPTHCKRGHEFTEENTYTDKRGSRHCRVCGVNRGAADEKKPRDERRRVDGKCRNGHDIAAHGHMVGDRLRCKECHRIRNQEYRARRYAASEA
ncbi:hypothetical protein GCM10023258_18130 [Terrabacter aeriphilus]|uniref:HNH nuclease domain-containing protein n=1 Tax=Terrabacter aeriphilus TaxID=515662 RepID=A0ABP9JBP4_9MICO